jgi:leader peptidase (prepilin peptidase) / N-methyltransferase
VAAAIVFMAVFGAILGSFISVVAHRLPRGESIVRPRSRCPECGATVAAYDNVPIVSWLLLRGRCRHCGARISPSYPLLELTLAVGFVASLIAFEDDPAKVALAGALLCTLATITLTDLEHRLIPNRVLIVSAVAGLALVLAGERDSVDERAIAAAVAFVSLFVVAVAYPQGMGMGDVKLAAVMGLYLGRAVAPALLIAFAAGALYGTILIARHGREARKRAIPFGPFLAIGGVAGLFVGEAMADWYTDEFFSA